VGRTVLPSAFRRVQYSVFECDLDPKAIAELRDRLDFEIDAKTDSCRWYRLCEGCRHEVYIMGRGDLFFEPPYVII